MESESQRDVNGFLKGNDSIIRPSSTLYRIKQQRGIILKLEDRITQLSREKNHARDKIRQMVKESERFRAILRVKIELLEKELKTYLVPPIHRLTSDGARLGSSSHIFLSNRRVGTPISHRQASSDGLSQLALPGQHSISAIPTLETSRTPGRRAALSEPHDQEPEQAVNVSSASVDPCVHLIFWRIERSLLHSEAQVSANQAVMQRFNFTQDSQNGKRMMNRVRVLESENEELERVNENGRPAWLSAVISLRQDILIQLRKANERIESLLEETEIETEVFASTLVMLQNQLGLARTTIELLAAALESVKPGSTTSLFERTGWPIVGNSCTHLHLIAKSETIESTPASLKGEPTTGSAQKTEEVSIDGEVHSSIPWFSDSLGLGEQLTGTKDNQKNTKLKQLKRTAVIQEWQEPITKHPHLYKKATINTEVSGVSECIDDKSGNFDTLNVFPAPHSDHTDIYASIASANPATVRDDIHVLHNRTRVEAEL